MSKSQRRRIKGWIVVAVVLSTVALSRLTAQERATEEEEQAPQTTAPASAGERSSVDYQASEQISEDLSVSFPIDI